MIKIMEEKKTEVCRLCLLLVRNYESMNATQQDMVQIVVPELNFGICDELFICIECNSTLQETFSFKSTCLEVEETIHNYTNGGQVQVNLDKLTGLKELEIHDQIERNTKICRTCLNTADPLSYIKVDNNDFPLESKMLNCSLPEVDFKLTKDPIICKNCLQLIKKQFDFHEKCVESENQISSFLQNNSDNFRTNFKLLDLFPNPLDKDNKGAKQVIHEKVLVNTENEETFKIQNSSSNEKLGKSSQFVNKESTTTRIEQGILRKTPSKDSLLDQLDTAISSCEDGIFEKKSEEDINNLPDNLNDLIDVVSDSSEENICKTGSIKKPYNTRNSNNKIIIETEDEEDDTSKDSDFKVDEMSPEEESDDDYVEGSEDFGWLPRNRKLPKELQFQRLVIQKKTCKFCQRQIFASVMAQHIVMCSKNPQNNMMVECAHCGVRTMTMQRLQQHMVSCQEYIEWKSKRTISTDIEGPVITGTKKHTVTVVYDIDQLVREDPREDVLEAIPTTSNGEKKMKLNPIEIIPYTLLNNLGTQVFVTNSNDTPVVGNGNTYLSQELSKDRTVLEITSLTVNISSSEENNLVMNSPQTTECAFQSNCSKKVSDEHSNKIEIQQNITVVEKFKSDHQNKHVNGKSQLETVLCSNLVTTDNLIEKNCELSAGTETSFLENLNVPNSNNLSVGQDIIIKEKSKLPLDDNAITSVETKLLRTIETVSLQDHDYSNTSKLLVHPTTQIEDGFEIEQNETIEDIFTSVSNELPAEVHSTVMNSEEPDTSRITNEKDSVFVEDEGMTVTSSTVDTTESLLLSLLSSDDKHLDKQLSLEDNPTVESITETVSTDSSVGVIKDGIKESGKDMKFSESIKSVEVVKNSLTKRAVADSSNNPGPTIASVSSGITTIDHMRSELTRMSVSFIDKASSQFLGVLKCDKCNYNTRHLIGIEKHVLTHFSQSKGNESYICVLCYQLKSGLYNFINHMKETHKHLFYKHFYWCVKCAEVLNDIKQIQFHECKNKNVSVKMFKSNGVVFCMLCKFESDSILEAKQHIKLCALKLTNLEPSDVIVIDDE